MIENNDESKMTLIGRKEELRRWALKPLWSEEEFRSLCCGICPGGSPGQFMRLAWDEALEIIRRAVAVNELPSVYRRATFFDAETDISGRFFKPDDAVRWALSTELFPQFPFSLADRPPSQNHKADEKHNPENAANKVQQDTLGGRERTTYENIIGGLLSLMLGQNDNGDPLSSYRSQAEIITDLVDRFPTANGISKSNLESKFADANRAIKQP